MLSRQERDNLFAKFASNWRRYGYLPYKVSINGKADFLTHIQSDAGNMVERMNIGYALRKYSNLGEHISQVGDLSEEVKQYIVRNPPSFFYIPSGQPFGLHDFVKVIQNRYDGITRAPNQHLVIEGKDLFTLLKRDYAYLPVEFLRQAIHIVGKDIRYTLSFAKMLFARIKNEKVEKSPCSKPCLVNIFRVIPFLLLVKLVNGFQLVITKYLLFRPLLTDDEPDDIGDYPPANNLSESKDMKLIRLSANTIVTVACNNCGAKYVANLHSEGKVTLIERLNRKGANSYQDWKPHVCHK